MSQHFNNNNKNTVSGDVFGATQRVLLMVFGLIFMAVGAVLYLLAALHLEVSSHFAVFGVCVGILGLLALVCSRDSSQ